MIDELIRKYGKYMGGIDYEKVLNDIISEEDRLREIERRLIGIETGRQTNYEKLRELEKRQLILKYIELKNQERNMLELIKELKLKGYTKTEVTKAIRRLRRIRRQIRMIKRELKLINEEPTNTTKDLKTDVFNEQ
ncbi:hypothetical protein [Vulcanisaeta distributa]|uniref:Uncharacterized protein n=1 Tax=Vulcanisaeta distributa (strain DSM 14429 / JCM 11212 / NBRC 100878 / IC-017) TaxID=572478 RepID=E1QS80_VULDI|nr:hypothetical protein [Vulcanisaeta distributa]ADN49473.1 conserved hypothetical protein [Vulcanisaeta distributa DSM 14429]